MRLSIDFRTFFERILELLNASCHYGRVYSQKNKGHEVLGQFNHSSRMIVINKELISKFGNDASEATTFFHELGHLINDATTFQMDGTNMKELFADFICEELCSIWNENMVEGIVRHKKHFLTLVDSNVVEFIKCEAHRCLMLVLEQIDY